MKQNTSPKKSRAMLIVLDGWGLNKDYPGNAITQAQTPFFDELWQNYPTAVLEASGESVGLPEGQMGTSEVNHFTIGAGKVVFQDLVRINKAVNDDSILTNPTLLRLIETAQKNATQLHIIGLLSDGGVHSHQDHIHALATAAVQQGFADRLVLHPITDGRDTSPHGGASYVHQLQQHLDQLGGGRIGSVGGRYYAMDRDHNWDRTDLYYETLVNENTVSHSLVAEKVIEASYAAGVTDEYLRPVLLQPPAGMRSHIAAGDVVLFANFRNDRPRQLVERLLERGPKRLNLATLTEYHPEYDLPVLFPPQSRPDPVGKFISAAGLRQLRITETEKFAHMTFFINCQHQEVYEGEDRMMFDSYSDIPTHDHRPQMRALDIAQAITDDIKAGQHEVIFTNLCNPDMVGHTGNIPAAITACEAVDLALNQIVPVALEYGFTIFITADHGNADEMLDEETGQPITSHSLNPVPLILVSQYFTQLKSKSGSLIDIAPSILTALGLPIPDSMTGTSLLLENG